MNGLFTGQKLRNLLPAVDVFADPNLSDEAHDRPGDLPGPAWPLLRLGISFLKSGQSFDSDGLQPQPDHRTMVDIESLGVAGSAAKILRVRVSMPGAYSGPSDLYSNNADAVIPT